MRAHTDPTHGLPADLWRDGPHRVGPMGPVLARTGRPRVGRDQLLVKARTTSSRSTRCTSSAGRTNAVWVRAFWSCWTAWIVPISRPLGYAERSWGLRLRPAVTTVS